MPYAALSSAGEGDTEPAVQKGRQKRGGESQLRLNLRLPQKVDLRRIQMYLFE